MNTLDVRQQKGFTLIELMITVAIIAIITAIAYPSYRDNVRRGNRAEVRALLLENAQYMERFFSENNSYLQTAAAVPVAPVLPNLVSPRGATGTKVNYNIAFRAAPARGVMNYAIEAVPANAMAGDDCATYTYNQLGQKGSSGTLTGGMTTETCWSK
ncbi:type IV pilin protein [Undibacterium fentianense]|uniref:Prepilin-type N-terminal cleavage/methylation domain-containing protein n=1 Tax=Undibacterium fentianense TaxID=2828728 RepID=A0A941E4L0_9BURK|nr:type IV pilin protein [Undibacterium fentianense]MBR7801082.1 prepilin-type N-terminal cleavage/methylation domain-containing protein [Undibacterium fentianense]